MAWTPADPSTGASPRRPPIDQARSRTTRHEGSIDELQVVQAVLDGDRDAFAILVDREAAAVVRACQRVLSDLHEAEDVAQEAFVTAYRSLASWRGDGPFGAWLTRIAVRLALRQLGRRKAVTWLRPSALDDADQDATARLAASPRTQPEHLVLNAEHATATRRAVADLDEPYREVVALRFFGERSLEEIATLTGRPLGTVKTHLRRGLLRLRDRIEPGGPA
ncbi:MAG TPA: sigma-70 family RNA polymerase sigma factor [Candidatus Limnocylindrales bacterium]|nr:sigma-70 family RNA polymerase sigma factor [Candidatus Limnocylindrales bacterium]